MYRGAKSIRKAAQRILMEQFLGRKQLDRRRFERLHRLLYTNRSFYASRQDTAAGKYRRISAEEATTL